MTEPTPKAPTETPLRPRRGRRLGLLLLLVGVPLLLGFTAPWWAAPLVSAELVAILQASTGGEAHIDELRLDWGGARLSGLDVEDAEGRPLLRATAADVRVDVIAALWGRYDADVRLADAEIHLRRREDGRWNLEHILERAGDQDGDKDEDGDDENDEAASSPESVRVGVQVADARLIVHAPDAPGSDDSESTTLQLESFTLDVSGEATVQPFALAAVVHGPDGEAGRLTADGTLAIPELGPVSPADLGADVGFSLEAFDLAGLAPVFAALGDLPALAGTVRGGGRARMHGPGLLVGDVDLILTDLQVDDQSAPAALKLVARASADEDLAGTQVLQLTLGEGLTVDWNGQTADPLGAAGRLSGDLGVDADLAALVPLLRPWSPLVEGLDLTGLLHVDAQLAAELSDGRPGSGRLSARADLTGLSVRGGDGVLLPLADLSAAHAELEGSLDLEHGRLELPTVRLDAGPLGFDAQVFAENLGGDAPVLQPSAWQLRADLDTLAPLLATLEGLPRLGGRVAGRGHAQWNGAGVLQGDVDLTVDELLIDDQLAPGPVTLVAQAAADEDLAGTQTARLSLGDALTVDWDGSTRAPLGPEGRLDGVLGLRGDLATMLPMVRRWIPLAEGVTLGGGMTVAATLGADLRNGAPSTGQLVADVDLEHLAALDAEGSAIPLPGLTAGQLDFDGRWDLERGRVEVPSLRLEAGPVSLDARFSAEDLLGDAPVLHPSQLDLLADLDALAEALGPVLPPGTPGFGGKAKGHFEIRPLPGPPGEAPVDVVGTLDVTDLLLSGLTVGEELLSLAPAPLHLEHDVRFDPRPDGRSEIRRLVVTSPWLDVTGRGERVGQDGPLDGDATLTLHVRYLAPVLARLVPGLALGGGDITVETRFSGGASGLAASGNVAAPDLSASWTDAEGRRSELPAQAVSVAFDVTSPAPDPGAFAEHPLSLRALTLALPGLDLVVAGTVSSLAAETGPEADLTVSTRGRLDTLLSGLGSFVGELPGRAAGFDGEHRLARRGGRVDLQGSFGLDDLRVVVGEGAEAFEIVEPRLQLDTTAGLDLDAGALDLTRLGIQGGLIAGTVSGRIDGLPRGAEHSAGLDLGLVGMRADLVWQPGALAPILSGAVSLPAGVALVGVDGEPLTLQLDGRWNGDVVALLRDGALTARTGLSTWSIPGGSLGGPLDITATDGVVMLDTQLETTRGSVRVGGRVDLDEVRTAGGAPGADLSLLLDGFGLTADVAALLSGLHPALASVKGGDLSGQIDLELKAAWAGPVPRAVDALLLDLSPLTADGTLGLRGVDVSRSPLIQEMVATLDPKGKHSVVVAPVSFTVRMGRVAYAQPWTWVVDTIPTAFRGSVGFDGSVDMVWDVPITQALADRHSFWKRFVGDTISIPVDGSVAAPRLRVEGLAGDLAGNALEHELDERLGKLDDLLGQGTQDPAELLSAADELWAAGKPAEARPLYQALRENHRLSLVYVLNKDRIKDRAEEPKTTDPSSPKKEKKKQGGMGSGA